MSNKLAEAIAAVKRAYNKEGGPDCIPLRYALETLQALQKKQKHEKGKAPN